MLIQQEQEKGEKTGDEDEPGRGESSQILWKRIKSTINQRIVIGVNQRGATDMSNQRILGKEGERGNQKKGGGKTSKGKQQQQCSKLPGREESGTTEAL